MALDQELRRQLIAAREKIGIQLGQLEGAALDPYDGGLAPSGMPDCRKVYADLQRELHEIDMLLENGEDGKVSDDARSDYQPMVRWYADGTVGNPAKATKAGIILGVISVCLLVVSLGVALLTQ